MKKVVETSEVVKTSEVAHLWANKVQDEARNAHRNLYFDGKTIYSYGQHFAIATHYKDIVLFTTRKYSNTTAKHISIVRSACSHLTKIYVPNPSETDYTLGNESVWIREIESLFKPLASARKPEIYYNQLLSLFDNIEKYFKVVGKKPSKELSALIKQIKAGSEGITSKIKAQKEKELKAILSNAKYANKYIELWRKCADHETIVNALGSKLSCAKKYIDQMQITTLRIIGDNVNTSKGIDLPIPVAKRYLERFLLGQIKVGEEILHYRVKSVSKKHIEIGCHNIPLSEIDWFKNNINN